VLSQVVLEAGHLMSVVLMHVEYWMDREPVVQTGILFLLCVTTSTGSGSAQSLSVATSEIHFHWVRRNGSGTSTSKISGKVLYKLGVCWVLHCAL